MCTGFSMGTLLIQVPFGRNTLFMSHGKLTAAPSSNIHNLLHIEMHSVEPCVHLSVC